MSVIEDLQSCLICVARRVPMKERPVLPSSESFTTRQDLQGKCSFQRGPEKAFPNTYRFLNARSMLRNRQEAGTAAAAGGSGAEQRGAGRRGTLVFAVCPFGPRTRAACSQRTWFYVLSTCASTGSACRADARGSPAGKITSLDTSTMRAAMKPGWEDLVRRCIQKFHAQHEGESVSYAKRHHHEGEHRPGRFSRGRRAKLRPPAESSLRNGDPRRSASGPRAWAPFVVASACRAPPGRGRRLKGDSIGEAVGRSVWQFASK